jgi:hypothetical protein
MLLSFSFFALSLTKPSLSLSHLCRLLTASGWALSVASGEEGARAAGEAATARTAREEEEDGTEG